MLLNKRSSGGDHAGGTRVQQIQRVFVCSQNPGRLEAGMDVAHRAKKGEGPGRLKQVLLGELSGQGGMG